MRSILAFVMIVPLAACGGGQKTGATATASSAPAADGCAGAAENLLSLLKTQGDMSTMPAEAYSELQTSFAQSCRTDAWSAELQQCVSTATDDTQLDACEALFSEAQKEAFASATGAVLTRYMGGAGYGGDTYGG